MVASRTTTSKKTTSKTTTSKTTTGTAVKKPLAKKVASATPAVKKPVSKAKTAATPAKRVSTKKAEKPLPANSAAVNVKSAMASAQKITVSPEERYRMIAAEAYLRAERRNFANGRALDDWIAAEAEIDARLRS